MNKPMEPQIILGMGAGHCGLNLLGEILARQPSSQITQEQTPILSWEHRPGSPGIKQRIARWKSAGQQRYMGDMAQFYLPYVEDAIACEPGIRIICLQRARDEIVSVFSQALDEGSPLPINHWAKDPGPNWYHHPLWTQSFPQYEIQDRVAGITRYWDEYYEHADELAQQYPDNVIVVQTHCLTNDDGVRRILDFVGIDRDRQVILTGRQPQQAPPIVTAGLPASRYEDPFDPRRCVVLVPFFTGIHQQCDDALKELERRGYPVRRVGGYAAIDQGRNQMATDALVDGFEETLWIDSDIGFHPDDVEKLRRHRLPVVCGIYPQKDKRAFACEFMPGMERVTFGKEGGLMEILYAGTGFLLIRREVYVTIQREHKLPICNERYERPMIPFFKPMVRPVDDGHWYLAEDFSFCERAGQSGFKVYADTSIRLWHIGNYRYGWEDAGLETTRHDSFILNATLKTGDAG